MVNAKYSEARFLELTSIVSAQQTQINELIAKVKELEEKKPKPKEKKEKKEKKEVDENSLCFGRVWGGGSGSRCTRIALNGKCYCKQHQEQADQNALKHGDIRVTGTGSIPLHKSLTKKLYGNDTPLTHPEGFDLKILGFTDEQIALYDNEEEEVLAEVSAKFAELEQEEEEVELEEEEYVEE